MLLSLVSKETVLGLLIGQKLGRWGKLNGMLGGRKQIEREKERERETERKIDAMDLRPEVDMLKFF